MEKLEKPRYSRSQENRFQDGKHKAYIVQVGEKSENVYNIPSQKFRYVGKVPMLPPTKKRKKGKLFQCTIELAKINEEENLFMVHNKGH